VTKGKAKKTKAGVGAAIWAGPDSLRAMLHPFEALHQDPRNPRKHDDRNLEAIRASLFQFGQLRPIVVQRSTMQVVAGNGTLQAARLAGWTHVAALVADMSDSQARAFAIADNRTAELAAWDAENLAAALADPELDELLGSTGFSADEIEKLIGETAGGLHVEPDQATRATSATVRSGGSIAGEPEDDDGEDEADGRAEREPAAAAPADADDEVPELPKEPKTKPGDVWICGEHQLLCGDSFGDLALEFLGRSRFDAVVTDPPYAIYGSSTGVGSDVADDKMVRPFFEALGRRLLGAVRKFAHVYVFCDWRSWSAVSAGMKAAPLTAKNCLIWDKGDFGLGSMYRSCHEFVGFFVAEPKRESHYKEPARGHRLVMQPNVRRQNRTGQGGFESEQEPGQRFHNAAKPVDLLAWLMANSTDEGDRVLDLFGGSGSTMIAAEKCKRRATLVEIEPKFCDVIVARWERMTGQTAERRPAR
jgi:DNA modification methylase